MNFNHFQDDFVRHLHSFNYKFLADTDGDHYPRFALYTLGGANYNYVRFPFFTYGMGASNVLEDAGSDAVIPVAEIIDGLADFRYNQTYYQIDAPVGCSQGDNGSCWFTMLTDPSTNLHQRAHRGIIVRNFHGRLNGEAWPPSGSEVSPFTFSLIKSRQSNSAMNTVSLELGLPSEFLTAVANGAASFLEGDYLSGDIEVLLPPRQTADTFSDSNILGDWLSDAGVDADFKQGWKLIAKEASKGDEIVTTVFQGTLERLYHPRIEVDGSDEARFNIAIPDEMPGILPITITGVEAGKRFSESLLAKPLGKLWRYVSDSWVEFALDGNYQLDKDVLTNSYTYVYSLQLEFASPAVGSCEQFAFGETAPLDTNPTC